ncbi:MAG: hypothetical protein JW787_11220 [Sedimentisphaerales bacterium]|nr:hypothetical protein [Sedimentisphaerales bacterium]
MSTTLDGLKLFDGNQLQIEAGSYKRELIEKSAPMLDGVISIDLGRRSRIIKQTGTLRAKSRSLLNERILAVSNCMDGNTHILDAESGLYQNLRMDSFKVTKEREDGTGITADYEIAYTQLA